jgi:hypothetical protein
MADVSKINSYAVTGGFDDRATITKFVGYAVTNDADNHMSVSKLVAYAVGVESPVSTARPQVFVCT